MKKTLLGIVLGCLVSDAWAYSAADYKQEGLLNQWDAIENAGPYRHDANATVWKDLAGGKTVYGSRDLELTENGSWGDGWLNVNGLSAVGSDKTTDYKTIEIVYRMTENPGDGAIAFASGLNTSHIAYFRAVSGTVRFMCHADGSWQKHIKPGFDAGKDYSIVGETQGNPHNWFCLNGKKVSTTDDNGSCSVASGKILVGDNRAESGTKPWYGRIYAIRLYDHFLTTDEVAAHYKIDQARFFGVYPKNSVYVMADDEGLGSPTPGYGLREGLTVGETYVFTAEQFSTNAAQTAAAECLGWELYRPGEATPFRTSGDAGETPYSCSVEYAEPVRLKWLWDNAVYRVQASVAGGVVSCTDQWVAKGDSVTVSVTPEDGWEFCGWQGDSTSLEKSLVFASLDAPRTLSGMCVKTNYADAAVTLFVSPNGSDENDGLSGVRSLKTIAAAVGKLADVEGIGYVFLAPGRHDLTEQIGLSKPIRVIGADRDQAIVTSSLASRAFVLSDANAGIENMKLWRCKLAAQSGQNGGAVSMSAGTVRNCLIDDCHSSGGWSYGHGCGIYLSGGLVTDCEFTHNVSDSAKVVGNALYINGSSAVVSNCNIHANDGGASNSDYLQGSAIIYLANGLLTCSRIHHNNKDSISGVYQTGGKIVNCLFYGNTSKLGSAAIYKTNGEVYYTTIFGNVVSDDTSGISGLVQTKGTVKNCIIYGNGPEGGSAGSCKVSGGTFEHNVVDKAVAGFDVNRAADPKFVDAENADFRLADRSSAAYRYAAPLAAYGFDITGHARHAETPDCGAYEYDSSTEKFAVSLKLDQTRFPLGSAVTAEAVISGAEEVECTIAWTIDGEVCPGLTTSVVTIDDFSPGRHSISVAIVRGEDCAQSEVSKVELCPDHVYVNTTGSGTFPYDTAEKGTNSINEAFAALWTDSSRTALVEVAEGVYTQSGAITLQVPVEIVGAGKDKTVFRRSYTSGYGFVLAHKAARVSGLSCADFKGRGFSMSTGSIFDCAVRNCTDSGDTRGVGLAISGGSAVGCEFIGITNTDQQVMGAGIYQTDGVVSNCLVRSCRGAYSQYGYGGGLFISGTGRFVCSEISDCSMAGPKGAAAYMTRNSQTSARPLIDSCVITGNLAAADGSAIFIERGDIRNSLVAHNRGEDGVAAGIIDFSVNRYNNMAASTVLNSTIAGNRGFKKALVAEFGSFTNTVLAANDGGYDTVGKDVTMSDGKTIVHGVMSFGHCNCPALTDGVDGNQTADPRFKSAGNFHLLNSSPCINAGDPTAFPSAESAVDLDGRPRMKGEGIDMGCYENPLLGLLLMVR